MFIKLSKIKRKFRKIALKLFHSIENNNNCDFETNGEKLFLNNLSYLLQKSNEIKTIFDVGANIGDYSDNIRIITNISPHIKNSFYFITLL